MQGPYLPELSSWLGERSAGYDAIVFFTYLYYTTWAGLRAVAGSAPTVLHPTAHLEPPMSLPAYETMFRTPTAFAFLTEEEKQLVCSRFSISPPGDIFGVGVDLDASGDGSRFREASEVGERPYLLYLGRVDPGKGSEELFEYFTTYKRRNPGPLALVVLGEQVRPLPPHNDVFPAAFAEDGVKRDAIDGCIALAQPSYFESFSIVLAEAWAQRRPALVQGRCAVLAGQAGRSGGAIPYRGFAEFEAGVDLLLTDTRVGERLGTAGRTYVELRYQWAEILDRYERFLDRTADTWPRHRLSYRLLPASPVSAD